jgi:hypothetical protein
VKDLGKLKDGEIIKQLYLPLVQASGCCCQMTAREYSIVKLGDMQLTCSRVFVCPTMMSSITITS